MSGSDHDVEQAVARGIQRQKDARAASGLVGSLGCLGTLIVVIALLTVLHVRAGTGLVAVVLAVSLVVGFWLGATVLKRSLK